MLELKSLKARVSMIKSASMFGTIQNYRNDFPEKGMMQLWELNEVNHYQAYLMQFKVPISRLEARDLLLWLNQIWNDLVIPEAATARDLGYYHELAGKVEGAQSKYKSRALSSLPHSQRICEG